MAVSPLAPFHPAVRGWFERAFEDPTPAQAKGWPPIARGEHTLISAPTGSGKTLAAFLWGLDRLTSDPIAGERRTRLLYVSPLKALSYDIERNLRAPLRGIRAELEREGAAAPEISVAIRTGDTPQRERQAMLRKPPDVLITTPESLYLMLTSRAREILAGVEAVIVDEIHAVAQTKRGSHLALTLERLEHLAERPVQRIGLSATQRPLEEVGRFLAGRDRQCTVVDAGAAKQLDLEIRVPVEDMVEPDAFPNADYEPMQGDGPTRQSIWPSIYPELLDLVEAHRSTIVFVNNRRLAERLALRLNELGAERQNGSSEEGAPPVAVDLARAHHGSLAREERLVVEDMLKAGELRCLVATSSLELGIDMGAVDLVVQVESPKSVTRGMQRVGRAGHSLGEVSKGRIFPKFRGDLLECAVVARRMREGAIEETVIPRNPLDVLSQQIVAMCADEDWKVDELHDVVTRAHPYTELGREQLENVLDMLDGRYPSDEFRELRARLVWDRVEGTLRARKGVRQLAVTNAGTIPDRGLYGVHLPDGRRVGELDEEMVYETRPGQTFLLGASTWRIEEITRDRVIVSPAPGVPAVVPFWKGDGVGRPAELGEAIGVFAREVAELEPGRAAALLRSDYDLDERAAGNLVAFLAEQREATRVIPSDRAVVVERFRDEIGDWRLCVLSPYGGRVHAAWGLALSARLRDERGIEPDAIWSDDGIVIHLPDADEPPSAAAVLIEPDELEELVVRELSGSALFGARFRENAARALLIPRARPGKRTPLWQQRLKAQSLLEVAKRYGQFPIILETYRECLKDVLDLASAELLLRRISTRAVSLVEVETATASPFASSLLFDYVATYMYEGDTPNAERRAAALSLDRDLLRELLGQEELRDLIDPAALAEVEEDLQRRSERTLAETRDALHDALRRLGDLTEREAAERVLPGLDAGAMLAELGSERRAVQLRLGGEQRFVPAEDAGLYRDALGAAPPGGLPDVFLEPVPDALARLLRRYARSHGPFTTAEVAGRYELVPDHAERALRELERSGDLVRGELRPGGSEREWCDPEVLRRLRRASLARLRKEIEPAEQRALARFLPAWQGVDARPASGAGPDRLREVLVPLQGLALAPQTWEQDVLPRRLGAYSQAWLDQLCASGELVWVGAGASGRSGKVALYFREDVAVIGPPPGSARAEPPVSPAHDAILGRLAQGACFWWDLGTELNHSAEELREALWDLVWAGAVTNDAWGPLRAPRLSVARERRAARRRFAQRREPGAPQTQGRWSLTAPLFEPAAPRPERARALAELLLERHGIVTRETVLAEGLPGGFASIYQELCDLETLGSARRGYFVEGLGGAQFALAGAVERLRSLDEASERDLVVLAATDPANPYGAVLPWPRREADGPGGGRRPARVPGAHVCLLGGEPCLYVERRGAGLVPLGEPEGDWLRPVLEALAAQVRAGRLGKLAVERWDGEPVVGSPVESILIELGFTQGPRKLTLSA